MFIHPERGARTRFLLKFFSKTNKNGHTNIPKVTKMGFEALRGIDFCRGRA